ncbi:MAG: ABC transporter transmembrane domain-containing protein, partial [Chthoniobacterales bacterium]
MSESQAAPAKPSLLQLIRIGWRPYRRLYSYVKPYRWRFIVGIASGGLFGMIASLMPLVLAKVTGVIFQGGGQVNPQQLAADPALLNAGPKLDSSVVWMCLALPGIMIVRSAFSYCNAYYMAWVSNRALTDIRDELFSKMLYHSMDFYNRMHSGFLMSRITNDTRGM